MYEVILTWFSFFGTKQEYHVTEKKEEQPTPMNAFELISMSRGLNLGNLFDEQVNDYELPFLSYLSCIFWNFWLISMVLVPGVTSRMIILSQ